MNEVFTKGAFLLKVHPPIYAAVHAVMLSKNHCRSSTLQKEGLGRDHLLLLHKQVHSLNTSFEMHVHSNAATLHDRILFNSYLGLLHKQT